MTEEKFNNKIKEYIERSRFWTEKTINQLGYSINLITFIGIGIFSYLITNSEKFLKMPLFLAKEKCWAHFFFYISLILTFLSILFGIISILSRLHDFRISRHLSLIRKKYLSKKKDETGLIKTEIDRNKKPRYISTFFKNILGNQILISEGDLSNDKILRDNFVNLQEQATVLGVITWKAHTFQILLLALSLLFMILVIVY
jgi:hypothetical protein